MATSPKKPGKKKMTDISQRVPVRKITKKPEPKIIEIENEVKNLDEKIEQFERKEEKEFEKEKKTEKKLKPKRRRIVRYILIGIIILAGAGAYSAIKFLPKAEIKVTTKKMDWSYVDSVTAGKNISQIDVNQKQIPAEIFSKKENFNFSFPATGKGQVAYKAGGKIIVYNAYGSDPQPLVANTRFVTPDGKIFRLVQKITVPGAKVVQGKIVPSNIEADAVADQVGPKYNIDPVSHFSIPGFQGSAKYQGFYGESKAAMTGGFIGETAYPTDQDIKIAEEKSGEQLKSSVALALQAQMPPEFKILDGTRQVVLSKPKVNPQVDDKNNFTVYSEAEATAIAFKESDLNSLMEKLAQAGSGNDNLKIKTYKLDYGAARPDFNQGKVSFALNFQGVFEQPIDVGSFRQNAANKNENELKSLVFSMSNIQKVTISFWPFWVIRAPDDLNRIKVEVE